MAEGKNEIADFLPFFEMIELKRAVNVLPIMNLMCPMHTPYAVGAMFDSKQSSISSE